MDLFAAIENRRSVRVFTNEPFPDEKVKQALQQALLAPNSSNTQTWDFYWVKDHEVKASLVKACLSQSAARTADHLVVVTADRKKWQRSQKRLIQWAVDSNAHPGVVSYYKKIVPLMYSNGWLSVFTPLKKSIFFVVGLFRPVLRRPMSNRDCDEVAIKSAALASQNFVLSISAQGGATCMMEGFDEVRVKRLLKLSHSSRVVMVIAVGYQAEKGIWGERFRLNPEEVIHIV
jgi:nitroreductase